jgi:hypothetical protein
MLERLNNAGQWVGHGYAFEREDGLSGKMANTSLATIP